MIDDLLGTWLTCSRSYATQTMLPSLVVDVFHDPQVLTGTLEVGPSIIRSPTQALTRDLWQFSVGLGPKQTDPLPPTIFIFQSFGASWKVHPHTRPTPNELHW